MRNADHPAQVGVFTSLRERNYRLYFAGQAISNTGTWMQRIAQDWLVLTLTGSAFAVGITTALQFLPVLLFGFAGGLVVDRFSKRAILLVTQALMGGLAALLAVLTLAGHVTVWDVYLVATLLGVVTVVDNPTRQVFVNEMVPRHLVRNAVSLNTATFQLARLVGPAVAGALIAVSGSGPAFTINAASYAATILALLAMRPAEFRHLPTAPRGRGQLAAGLRYVVRRPEILWVIVAVFFIGTFGYNFSVFLSAMAKTTFHAGSGLYGLLNTALAAGSLLGAGLAARRSQVRLRFLFAVAAGFSALTIVLGLTPWLLVFLLVLVVCGLMSTSFSTSSNASVQLASDPEVRGRVMSLYIMVNVGGTPIGGPISGWLTAQYGPPTAMILCGGVCLIAVVACLAFAARQTHTRLPHPTYLVRPAGRSVRAVREPRYERHAVRARIRRQRER